MKDHGSKHGCGQGEVHGGIEGFVHLVLGHGGSGLGAGCMS